MYQHILIATDGSELARKAITTGLRLAKDLKARATVVTVTEPWASYVAPPALVILPAEDYEEIAAARAATILSGAKDTAKEVGTPCTTLHIKDAYPADGVIEAAKEQGCDLIVMASHGRRGMARVLLGSQATHVLTHSTIPVLVCR